MPKPNISRPAIIPIGPSIAYLPLTKGLYSLIDAQDAEWFSEFRWQAHQNKSTQTYYVQMGVMVWRKPQKWIIVSMHRVILGLISSDRHIVADHRNGNGLDNRRANLRVATRSQNSANCRVRKDISLPKGVRRLGCRFKVVVNNKYKGIRNTLAEAVELYEVSAKIEFGEFYRVDLGKSADLLLAGEGQ